jgi:hypothetical protein
MRIPEKKGQLRTSGSSYGVYEDPAWLLARDGQRWHPSIAVQSLGGELPRWLRSISPELSKPPDWEVVLVHSGHAVARETDVESHHRCVVINRELDVAVPDCVFRIHVREEHLDTTAEGIIRLMNAQLLVTPDPAALWKMARWSKAASPVAVASGETLEPHDFSASVFYGLASGRDAASSLESQIRTLVDVEQTRGVLVVVLIRTDDAAAYTLYMFDEFVTALEDQFENLTFFAAVDIDASCTAVVIVG